MAFAFLFLFLEFHFAWFRLSAKVGWPDTKLDLLFLVRLQWLRFRPRFEWARHLPGRSLRLALG